MILRIARERALVRVGALVALALGLGACGIPLSSTAQGYTPRNLSSVLTGKNTPTTTTPKPPPVRTEHSRHLEIFLVNRAGTHLVGVRRSWTSPVTPQIALNVLAFGPTASDSKLGLQTDLAQGATTKVVGIKAGIASVTLDESTFLPLVGSSLYVPLAQIVFTLMTNFSSIRGVNFFLAVDPPVQYNYTPDGFNQPEPVTEQTYAALKPVPPTKSKTTTTTAKGTKR